MNLTAAAALVGVVAGTAGLVLGIMNYLRDEPKVLVKLLWDMTIDNDPRRDPSKRWGLVRVVNVGRRPIFVSHASLELPKRYGRDLLLWEGIQGRSLAEGDGPIVLATIDQDGIRQYAKDWTRIRAVIFDSAGKAYRSSKPRRTRPPSWARQ